jgi:hypothetical protein
MVLVVAAALAAGVATTVRDGADEREVRLAGGDDQGRWSDESQYGGPYEVLQRRDAPGGLRIRLYGDGWSNGPATAHDGFVMCDMTRTLVAEVSNDAMARQLWFQAFTTDAALTMVGQQQVGGPEGEPGWVLVVRVGDGVDEVLGAGDSTEPVDGYAALAGPGQMPVGASIEAVSGGEVVGTIAVGDEPPRCYTEADLPAPAPEPGEPPADVDEAEASVRDAYFDAFDHAADPAERDVAVAHLSEIQSLMDRAAQSFPDAVATVTVQVYEVIFTSPETAAVRFELNYSGGAEFGEQLGAAELVDGRWLVAKDTMCTVLLWAGVEC